MRSIMFQLRENPVDDEHLLYQHCIFKKNRRSGLKKLLIVPSFLRRDILYACHYTPMGGHNAMVAIWVAIWWPYGHMRSK